MLKKIEYCPKYKTIKECRNNMSFIIPGEDDFHHHIFFDDVKKLTQRN